MRASFLEIYNEEVRDLLSKNPKNKLDLKERKEQGVYVKGLNSFVVKSVAEITSVLEVSMRSVQRRPAECMHVPPLGCLAAGVSGSAAQKKARKRQEKSMLLGLNRTPQTWEQPGLAALEKRPKSATNCLPCCSPD